VVKEKIGFSSQKLVVLLHFWVRKGVTKKVFTSKRPASPLQGLNVVHRKYRNLTLFK